MRTWMARLPRIAMNVTCAAAFVIAPHGVCAQGTASGDTRPGRDWAVDPTMPGENLPPVGRSLFDHLFTRPDGARKVYDVPFPFSAVLKRLEAELRGHGVT